MGFEKAKRGNLAQSLVNLLYKLSLREFTKRAMMRRTLVILSFR